MHTEHVVVVANPLKCEMYQFLPSIAARVFRNGHECASSGENSQHEPEWTSFGIHELECLPLSLLSEVALVKFHALYFDVCGQHVVHVNAKYCVCLCGLQQLLCKKNPARQSLTL